MNKITTWISQNKLATGLLVVLGFFFLKGFFGGVGHYDLPTGMREMKVNSLTMAEPAIVDSEGYGGRGIMPPVGEFAPSDESSRMVVTSTNMSLLVDDVEESLKRVVEIAESAGGYMVNTSWSQPEGGASGSVSVRVPSAKLSETLEEMRGEAVRVVSVNVNGRDVTDEYVDIEARLALLYRTQAQMEDLMAKATRVEDMLKIQRELMSTQQQIDNLKGRQQYLEKTAELARVTVYMSTDELALPYSPDEVWRPQVVFRTAVRSLVSAGRRVVDLGIYLVVFAVVWVPVLLMVVWWRRRSGNKIKA